MAHFAKVENGIVTRVIVAEPEFFDTFVDETPGEWIQTSYNTFAGWHVDPKTLETTKEKALRKNYAGVGYTYDKDRDAFIPPKPFNSWILNEDTCRWDSSFASPQDGKIYKWNEQTLSWSLKYPE